MKWFDRNFDYIQEFAEHWNKHVKRLKWTFLVIAVLLVAVGILCIRFPVGTFAAMQTLAAAALIVQGIYFLVSFASTTGYFKDPMQIVMGILNIVLGLLLFASPVALTVNALTFMLAFLLLFSGAEKLAFARKLKYYRIMRTGLMTFCGVLSIVLAVVFLVLPLVSALVLHDIMAAYFIVNGVALLIEVLSMKRIAL